MPGATMRRPCSLLLLLLPVVALASVAAAQPSALPPEAREQIRSLLEQKRSRSLVERKVGSQLLYAERMARGLPVAPGVPTLHVDLDRHADGRVQVDVETDAAGVAAIAGAIEAAGGSVLARLVSRGAVRAWLPLDRLLSLASRPEVRAIRPAARAYTRKIDTSQGDLRHGAPLLRANLGVDGSGVGVGVLSDGVDSLASLQASGDVTGDVTVLPGQGGSGDEGSAMLEIVHDLAPGASLLFATAFNGQASFANNIVALRDAGADIIVDDVAYFAESVFQDDDVAAAVDAVTASGVLYFSAAGNSGNWNDGTSGVYEGDFVGGPGTIGGGSPHDYGGGLVFNEILLGSPFAYSLHWSDPNGGSGNDYDLFLLNKPGSVIFAASTDVQDGNDDPFEIVGTTPNDIGKNLVVVRTAGSSRYFHLTANRGRLAFATPGQTSGHSAARDAFSVAAVDARPGAGSFDGTEPVETYSSDGPRRVFYDSDGSAITPGVFDSSGGELRAKPDLAAADCVSTATPGFSTFCGTSAAAPHAAALAALLLEAAPSATPAQIRMALATTALDIEAVGFDRDSGAGIAFGPAAGTALPECSADADCDDGAFCNGAELCVGGSCAAGGGDPCAGGEAPFCDEAGDLCQECELDADCDDGAFCNGAELCVGGSCTAGGGDPCAGGGAPYCDEAGDLCVECGTDADCDDGAFCSGVESCSMGSCVPGGGDPCLGGPDPFCDEAGDVCVECGADADCDDGAFCNGPEECAAGICQPSAAPACADPGEAICVEPEAACVACLQASDCAGGELCLAGSCVQPVPALPGRWPWLLALTLIASGAWLGARGRSASPPGPTC